MHACKETLGPGVSVANLQDDYFLKAQHQQVNELLDKDFNHASIAFWGFFNEGPSNHEEACGGYQASSDAIFARDTTRFITYASNLLPPRDKCYGAATVISYNGYPGWYDAREPEEYWNSLSSELFSGRYPGAAGKPLVVSETGAGGIYEWKHNQTTAKWTLGYQSDIVSRDVATAIENTNISGIALWHFFGTCRSIGQSNVLSPIDPHRH
jgi:beta-glucuronidase